MANFNSYFKNKKILVTGGSGFVGTNLISRLLKEGAIVRATIHKKPPQLNNKKIEFIKVDLTKKSDCQKIVSGIDVVFMCAANTSGAAVIEKTPLTHVTPNVIMNSLMLEASHEAGIKKFIFISSNTVYPLTNYPVKEEDLNYNLYDKYFPVAWMKIFSEKLCEMYSTKIKNTMTTIIIRPGNIYGPFDDFNWETSHVIPALIRKAVERHSPYEVWGDGKDIKDFIFIDDFIDALLLSVYKINDFCILNIGAGKSITIKKILKYILNITNYNNAKLVFNTSKPSMIPVRLINTNKSKKIIGFKPKVDLKSGLKKTIDWYTKTTKRDQI